ncbi:MAG: hypothetical protein NVSMB29_17480 [Candidatus Dormibacteria bacterium]
METHTDGEETRWLHGVRTRLADLGYAPDESTTRQVAYQFKADTTPSDAQLHDAFGRAEVIRAMQRSLS